LVELLVVITIIAILASLTAGGVYMVVVKSKNTRIQLEIDNMATAMESLKTKYGAYPPADLRITNDPSSNPALRQFIARAFPRYNQVNLQRDLRNAGVPTGRFDPAVALVFWLGSFNADESNPFLPEFDLQSGNRNPGYTAAPPT